MLKQSIQYPDNAQVQKPVEVDPSTPVGNNFARGLEILLRHAGCATDYVTIMGDLGQAFILQGTEYDERLTGGYADLGWWPLDRWNMVNRLQFLSWVNGVGLHHHDVDFGGIGNDPARSYEKLFQSTVFHEITQDRALLAFWDGCHVVTGYDTEKPPLLGWCLFGYKPEEMRMNDYPCAITFYGSSCEVLDRQTADFRALRYAVDLGRGEVKYGLWVTGPSAWKGWEEHLLRRKTEYYWHANIKGNLQVQRDAAVQYLERMAMRYPDGVSLHLRKAAEIYRQQLELIGAMTMQSEITNPGKEQSALASLIRNAAVLDLKAIDSIDAAAALLIE